MALTFTRIQESVIGNLRCWIGTITFSSSYVTSGESYVPANFGMLTAPVFMEFDGATGYVFRHDRANKKILVYRSGGFAPAGTVSAPTLSVTGGIAGAVAIGIGTDANGAALSKTAATTRTGITGASVPIFTGTAQAAGLSEVAGAVNLATVITNVFVLGS